MIEIVLDDLLSNYNFTITSSYREQALHNETCKRTVLNSKDSVGYHFKFCLSKPEMYSKNSKGQYLQLFSQQD